MITNIVHYKSLQYESKSYGTLVCKQYITMILLTYKLTEEISQLKSLYMTKYCNPYITNYQINLRDLQLYGKVFHAWVFTYLNLVLTYNYHNYFIFIITIYSLDIIK